MINEHILKCEVKLIPNCVFINYLRNVPLRLSFVKAAINLQKSILLIWEKQYAAENAKAFIIGNATKKRDA